MAKCFATLLRRLLFLQIIILCTFLMMKKVNAETIHLPVTVRIVDCTSYEKSIALCQNESLCCGIADRQKPEFPDKPQRHKING